MDDPSGLKGSEDQASMHASPPPHLNSLRLGLHSHTLSRRIDIRARAPALCADARTRPAEPRFCGVGASRGSPLNAAKLRFHLPVGSIPAGAFK